MSERSKQESDELIQNNIGLVYSVIRKYYTTFVHDEDIISAGKLGLCKAANTWDEGITQFSTYAYTCIINEIRMELRSRAKQPETLSLEYELNDNDGNVTTYGDLIVGEFDIDYLDIDAIRELLDKREQEVLELKHIGMKSKEIGKELGIGAEQVRRIVRKIRKKLKEYE